MQSTFSTRFGHYSSVHRMLYFSHGNGNYEESHASCGGIVLAEVIAPLCLIDTLLEVHWDTSECSGVLASILHYNSDFNYSICA